MRDSHRTTSSAKACLSRLLYNPDTSSPSPSMILSNLVSFSFPLLLTPSSELSRLLVRRNNPFSSSSPKSSTFRPRKVVGVNIASSSKGDSSIASSVSGRGDGDMEMFRRVGFVVGGRTVVFRVTEDEFFPDERVVGGIDVERSRDCVFGAGVLPGLGCSRCSSSKVDHDKLRQEDA